MDNFRELGLDSNMFNLTSPLVRREPFVKSTDIGANYERNAITAYNIGNFNFSAGTGGTIVLGGTGNGNGLLSVKNQAGSEVVKLDSSGMTVTNGSVMIQNSSGSTIIDSGGLVGNINFIGSSIILGSLVDITNVDYVIIGNFSSTIITSRTTPTLFYAWAQTLTYTAGANYTQFRIQNVNGGTTTYPGTGTGANWQVQHDIAGEVYFFSILYPISLPSGTNVVSLMAKSLQVGSISIGSISHFGHLVLGA